MENDSTKILIFLHQTFIYLPLVSVYYFPLAHILLSFGHAFIHNYGNTIPLPASTGKDLTSLITRSLQGMGFYIRIHNYSISQGTQAAVLYLWSNLEIQFSLPGCHGEKIRHRPVRLYQRCRWCRVMWQCLPPGPVAWSIIWRIERHLQAVSNTWYRY